MKKTLLKFPSVIYLISFRRYSKATQWEIDLTNTTILCNCTPKEAQVACSDFGAKILEKQEAIAAPAIPEDGITVSINRYTDDGLLAQHAGTSLTG